MDFFSNIDIPLDIIIDDIVDFLNLNLSDFFDSLKNVLLVFLNSIQAMLMGIPWFIHIILLFILGKILTGIWLKALVWPFLLLCVGLLGYWENAMITLALTITAVIFSILLGIPLGIAMAKSDRYAFISKPILDAMQTMPSFVYLIPVLMLFGLGRVPALFATIVYALPPIIRLTNVGIRTVDKQTVEAARSFGATGLQLLTLVQIPLARPSIMVGINQTTMMALSMVVIGSMIGARGLGMDVMLSINRIQVGKGFEAGLCIVFLAVIIDRITLSLSKKQSTGLAEQGK